MQLFFSKYACNSNARQEDLAIDVGKSVLVHVLSLLAKTLCFSMTSHEAVSFTICCQVSFIRAHI